MCNFTLWKSPNNYYASCVTIHFSWGMPGDASAAAAGDLQAQSRIQALTSQMYGGHYSSLMAGPGHSPDPGMVPPPASAYPV